MKGALKGSPYGNPSPEIRKQLVLGSPTGGATAPWLRHGLGLSRLGGWPSSKIFRGFGKALQGVYRRGVRVNP